jgi:predicted aspartyl protease
MPAPYHRILLPPDLLLTSPRLAAEVNMRLTGFEGVLGIALLSGAPGWSAANASLHFDLLERHLIVVHGSIGAMDGLKLLIDTGAIPSMVDRKVARKLGLEVQEREFIAFGQKTRAATTVLPDIRIGPLHTAAVPAGVGDLGYLHGVDAIIGLDVLTRSSFSIDYDRRELTFGEPAQDDPGVRLEATPPFLTVQVTISGRHFRLLVDTGSNRLVLFERRVGNQLPLLPVHGELATYHLAGSSRLQRVTLPPVAAGDVTLDHVEGFLSDAPMEGYPAGIDGVLGVRVLASKRAGFDFERQRLAFAK